MADVAELEREADERNPEVTQDEAVKSNVTSILTDEDRAEFKRLMRNGQDHWLRHRDSLLYALHGQVPTFQAAILKPGKWAIFAIENSLAGDLPQNQVAELMVRGDDNVEDFFDSYPDGWEERNTHVPNTLLLRYRWPTLSRKLRATYGAGIAWFATPALCPHTDADDAVLRAKERGRLKGIAKEYRDFANPPPPPPSSPSSTPPRTEAQRQQFREARQNRVHSGGRAGPASADEGGLPPDGQEIIDKMRAKQAQPETQAQVEAEQQAEQIEPMSLDHARNIVKYGPIHDAEELIEAIINWRNDQPFYTLHHLPEDDGPISAWVMIRHPKTEELLFLRTDDLDICRQVAHQGLIEIGERDLED